MVEGRINRGSAGSLQRALQNEDQSSSAGQWYVVRTKTKCEKFVRDKIEALGMQAFVPLRKRTARYNRKVKTYELPLITCYTFVRLDKSKRNQVLALPYVQGFLKTGGYDSMVSEREIEWLQKISGTELEVRAETLSMHIGDRVILAYGQLAGMEGRIVSHHSKNEVIIALESLGLQMVIQVEKEMLEPAW